MSKYEPLRQHLRHIPSSRVAMRFKEIEAILGFDLPPSSRRHRAWWSNNPLNNVMTYAWLEAGFETEAVDIDRGRLVFRRVRAPDAGTRSPGTDQAEGAPARKPGRHPLFGCMQGTVTVSPEVDLTQPADPDWGRSADGDGH